MGCSSALVDEQAARDLDALHLADRGDPRWVRAHLDDDRFCWQGPGPLDPSDTGGHRSSGLDVRAHVEQHPARQEAVAAVRVARRPQQGARNVRPLIKTIGHPCE